MSLDMDAGGSGESASLVSRIVPVPASSRMALLADVAMVWASAPGAPGIKHVPRSAATAAARIRKERAALTMRLE